MYSRRRRMAAETGRKKITFNTAKKIAKLMSCTTMSCQSIDKNDIWLYFTKALTIAGTFATTSKM